MRENFLLGGAMCGGCVVTLARGGRGNRGPKGTRWLRAQTGLMCYSSQSTALAKQEILLRSPLYKIWELTDKALSS